MSGGGGGKQSTEQKPWKGVQPFLKEGYADATSMYEAGNLAGPSFYPGQTYVNRDPLENMSQQAKLSYAMGPMGAQAVNLGAANARMLNADQVFGNPAVEGQIDAVQRRLNQNLSENIMPGITNNAIAAGQYGGDRQGVVQGQAIGRTQEALGDAAANIYGDAYDSGLQAQYRAMAFAPQAMAAQMAPFDVVGGVGEYKRGEKELALQEAMNRYQYDGQRDVQNLQNYMNLLQGAPWGSTTQGSAQRGSPIAGALGGGLMGYAAAPALSTALGLANPVTLPFVLGGAALGGLLS